MERYGIEVGTVGPGSIDVYLTLPGEITLNQKPVHLCRPECEPIRCIAD